MRGLLIKGVIVLFCFSAQAETKIFVSPMEGVMDLDFGEVSFSSLVNRRVKVEIVSSENKQYQVFQRLQEGLVNERGVRLNPSTIISYTLPGSSMRGSLYQQQPVSLSYNDQLLYVSAPEGGSDSFVVVYTLKGEKLNDYGQFLGRIVYTLRPIQGGEEEVAILEISLKAESAVEVKCYTEKGDDVLRLTTRSEQTKTGYVRFSLKGARGGKWRVYQEVSCGWENEIGERISSEEIKFFTSQGEGEHIFSSPAPLKEERTVIYSSDKREDSFLIHFLLGEGIKEKKTGVYRGRLRYLVEGEGFQQWIDLDLEVEVCPVFNLEISFPPGGIKFSNLLPPSSQFKEVKVEVKTNLGQPYIVMHTLTSPLTNEKGNQILPEFFAFKQEIEEGEKGKVRFGEFSPVPVGDVPVFFSDEKGSPAKFKVIYRLSPYKGMYAGSYTTVVSYSLAER